MVRFWDASALVPLIMEESTSAAARALARDGGEILAWWGTEIEYASAFARAQRDGRGLPAEAFTRLRAFADGWQVVGPSPVMKSTAVRLLRVHALRAPDALQLAAALISIERLSAGLEFVTLDTRLAEAAHKEGFRLAVFG